MGVMITSSLFQMSSTTVVLMGRMRYHPVTNLQRSMAMLMLYSLFCAVKVCFYGAVGSSWRCR